MRSALKRFFSTLSPAAWMIAGLALASSAGMALIRVPPERGIQFWTFSEEHMAYYRKAVAEWNHLHPGKTVQVTLVSGNSLQQRMMSAFFSGTPLADVLEVERTMIGPAFSGPVDKVGFDDLTPRLRTAGLIGGINPPSFGPWTSRGHIFGIPHDVHPVLLAYRSDLVEAAGIDVSKIETWDDYFRALAPLMTDATGARRYLVNGWYTDPYTCEILLLESGGALFDRSERPTLNTPFNARFIAKLATWYVGPHRVAHSMDYFTASGHQFLVQGQLLAVMVPDWYVGMKLKSEIPTLAGKMKLMPLPAWEPGGRRTSAWGGSMLGIARSSKLQEADWDFAQFLYLSRENAENLFRNDGIVSPIRANWSDPVYEKPDPYFCGQRVGRIFISQATHVPWRTSSPYNDEALTAFDGCLIRVAEYAEGAGQYDPAALVPKAEQMLDAAQQEIVNEIGRNVFLSK